MILLIDNYDSFVHNLARYLRRLGQETVVVRNDAITLPQIEALHPGAIVLSPGPCTPDEAGISLDIARDLYGQFPLLGVCLGHQVIAQAFFASIVRAPQPMHGRTSEIVHQGRGLFAGLPSPLMVCRYHSLVVEEATLSHSLAVTARTVSGVVMAIEHRNHPVCGVQFHPEAILTQGGFRMLANFLQNAKIPFDRAAIPPDEWTPQREADYVPPSRPVTF